MAKQITCPLCKNKQDDVWQFCHKCGYNIHYQSLTIISKPSWIQESERIANSRTEDDPDIESKAADAYTEMREREIQTSRKARLWEESRKEELKRYKPTWVKRGRNSSELKDITKV